MISSYPTRVRYLSSVYKALKDLTVLLAIARPFLFVVFDPAEKTAYDTLVGALNAMLTKAPFPAQ